MLLALSPNELWTRALPFKLGGIEIGTHTTVVRLADQSLALISPGPEDVAFRGELAGLGPISALVAPNAMHHLFLRAHRERAPQARVFGPTRIQEKYPDLSVAPLSEFVPLIEGRLELIPVEGMPKLDETLFLHPATRTLVVTDLAFNIRAPLGWFGRTLMRLNDGYDRFGPTRLARSLIRDRAALARTIAAIQAHVPERIVVAHGELVTQNATQAIEEAFGFLR